MNVASRIVATGTLLVIFTSCQSTKIAQVNISTAQESSADSANSCTRHLFNPNILMVSYDGEIGKENVKKAVKETGANIVYEYQNFNMFAIRKPDDMSIARAIEFFRNVEGVTNAVEDQMCEVDSSTDDIRM